MTTAIQRQLAEAIKTSIYDEFTQKHLSGNLMSTMAIAENEDDVQLRIPAVRYDLKEWNKNKAVVYHQEWGSYANAVDISGGFSRTHQSYVDRAITKSIYQVVGMLGLDFETEVY